MAETPTDIDVTAVVAQIQTLKQQRSNAMDDVAVLLGQLESKNKAYDELLQRYTDLKAASQDAGETEDIVNTTTTT